jgi:hypothetical protein
LYHEAPHEQDQYLVGREPIFLSKLRAALLINWLVQREINTISQFKGLCVRHAVCSQKGADTTVVRNDALAVAEYGTSYKRIDQPLRTHHHPARVLHKGHVLGQEQWSCKAPRRKCGEPARLVEHIMHMDNVCCTHLTPHHAKRVPPK